MSFLLEIVTPEREAFSDQVDGVTLPGVDGELGILEMHAALITCIEPGEVEVRKGSETFQLAVGEGFVEVLGDSVAIMTDMAIEADDIDENAAEEAIKRAEDAMAGTDGQDTEQLAALQATIQRSLAQLQVKRRRNRV